MEVTDKTLTNDSIYIGISKEPEKEFTLSNNGALFDLLSTSLYSNKELAVIREIICNAWDSHIQSNKQDIPIEITLTEHNFSVRDFGSGIDPEKIIDIYCTYGDSTKVDDPTQVGGFGLGSKAPFAYTNTFTVTNYFNKQQEVYILNKEPQQTPTIKKIYSRSTFETGLLVDVIINNKDYGKFYNDLINFLKFSGINCKLNNNVIETIRMNANDFIIDKEYYHISDRGLFIKYGSVIYPVSKNNLNKFIFDLIDTTIYSYIPKLILNAEPNTLALTPSRESLLYTNKTIKTIKKLFLNFIFKLKKEIFINFDKLVNNTNTLKEFYINREDYFNSDLKIFTDYDILSKNVIINYFKSRCIGFGRKSYTSIIIERFHYKIEAFMVKLFLNNDIERYAELFNKSIQQDEYLIVSTYYKDLITNLNNNVNSYSTYKGIIDISNKNYNMSTTNFLTKQQQINTKLIYSNLFDFKSNVILTNNIKSLQSNQKIKELIYNNTEYNSYGNSKQFLILECNKKHFDSMEKTLNKFSLNVILKYDEPKKKNNIITKKPEIKELIYINKTNTNYDVEFKKYGLMENKVDNVLFLELDRKSIRYDYHTSIIYIKELIKLGIINNLVITDKISIYNYYIKNNAKDIKDYLYNFDTMLKNNIINPIILNDYLYLLNKTIFTCNSRYYYTETKIDRIIELIVNNFIILKNNSIKLYDCLKYINDHMKIINYITHQRHYIVFSKKHEYLLKILKDANKDIDNKLKPNKHLENIWDRINIDVFFKDKYLFDQFKDISLLFEIKLNQKKKED